VGDQADGLATLVWPFAHATVRDRRDLLDAEGDGHLAVRMDLHLRTIALDDLIDVFAGWAECDVPEWRDEVPRRKEEEHHRYLLIVAYLVPGAGRAPGRRYYGVRHRMAYTGLPEPRQVAAGAVAVGRRRGESSLGPPGTHPRYEVGRRSALVRRALDPAYESSERIRRAIEPHRVARERT
jgi:hypothetical protein